MSTTTTPNKGYILPTVAGDAGIWGTELNNSVISIIDTNLGGVQAINAALGSATLTSTQTANLRYAITGVLAGNITLTFPSTAGGNGIYVIDNQATGGFTVTIATSYSSGSTVIAPPGARTLVSGDGVNFTFADDSRTAAFDTQLGTPQGNVAGVAGTANRSVTNVEWDATNRVQYVATLTGNAATTVWTPAYSNVFTPQGYLTPVSGTPIITGDSLSATTIYYTPYYGNWTFLSNGITIYPYQFPEISYALTNTLLANNIYDVFIYNSSIGPLIGTGPSWAVGSGGSVTPGACVRGTGGAGTALARLKGVLTNASAALTFNSSVTVAPPGTNQAVYLGSIFIDSTPGQVTCHRGYGQSRKWGIWNAYNRTPLYLKAGDPNSSWTGNFSGNYRPSNNNAANSLTFFAGLQEEMGEFVFSQSINWVSGVAQSPKLGIGVNSITTPSGQIVNPAPNTSPSVFGTFSARYITLPSIGINTVTSLENGATSGTLSAYGQETNMLLSAHWRG